jgi:hypothetical protein
VKKNSMQENDMMNIMACLSPRFMVSCATVKLIFPGGTYPIKLAMMPIKKVRNIIPGLKVVSIIKQLGICLLSGI